MVANPRTYSRRQALVLLASALTLGLAASRIARSPQPLPEPSAPAPPTPAPLTYHPRLFFSSPEVPDLRKQAETTHRQLWQPILDFARGQLNSNPPSVPKEGDLDAYRNAGNEMIALAFACVITRDRALLDVSRRNLLAFTTWKDWGDEGGYGNRDLGFHQMLLGNAIAYDWLHGDLSDVDRATIGRNLARRAQESYEASSSPDYRWNNWWRKAYTQNHHWTNHSALGIAALVLEGEDERSRVWRDHAISQLDRDRYLAEGIGDGSWHEGIPYQDYGLTLFLPFLDNLRRLKRQDLIPHSYLRNYVYWRVYNSLPGTNRFALSFGDFEFSWGDPYGPEGLLRFAAKEYRNGHAEWIAQQIAGNSGRASTVYSVPWYVFEFFYYDPTVALKAPSDLPLSRTFPDLEGVIWRTGWDEEDITFGLKAGVPGGRFPFDSFTKGEGHPFDPDTDVDMFHTEHDHDDANTFYLYRGKVDLASERVGYQRTDSSFHNTLLVDGKGQYRSRGDNTDPARYQGIDGRLETASEAGGFSYLAAEASGRYTDSRDGRPGARVIDEFKRHVLFVRPDYLVMVDSLKARSPHRYEWVSHFGSSVAMEGDWVKGGSAGDQLLGVKIVAPQGFATTTGNDGKPYLRIRPSSDIASTRFVTLLYPTDSAGWRGKPSVSLLIDNDQVSGVRVLMKGTQDHLVKHGTQDTVAAGDYSFDGQVASVIKDTEGNLQRVFLGQGSRLSDALGRRVLIQSTSKISAVELAYAGSALSVSGDNLAGVTIYGPQVDASRVTVNGKPVTVSRKGDYLVLP